MIDSLLGMGRPGGVILLLAAAGVWAAGEWMAAETGSFFIVIPALSLGLAVLGLFLVAMGAPGGGAITLGVAKKADIRVQRAIEARSLPFHYCTHCLEFCEVGICDTCMRTVDVLPARTEAERKTVLVALDLS